MPYALCVSRSLLVLERRLLEILSSVGGSVLLLGELRLCRGTAIDGLVLLRRLAGSVSATACFFLGLFSLKTLNLLLRLGNVLLSALAVCQVAQ